MTAHVPLVIGGCSVLDLPEDDQPGVLFIVNGALSTVSDNVFVATVFIKGVAE
jgi:NhaB family Na+:H+ antiporter|eukprot:COSAG02_NODE_2391_length_8978_cov_14.980403_7_plen_53_part_00